MRLWFTTIRPVRTIWVPAVAALAMSSTLVAGVCAADPANPAIKTLPPRFVVPEGKTFVDLLNTQVPTDDATDMSLRFRDGPRVWPRNAMIIDRTVMKPWIDDMESLFDRFLSAYTLGPKPLPGSIPIYIVDDPDINCVIQAEDSEDPDPRAQTGSLGFDGAQPANPVSPGTGAKVEPEIPARLELRCTELALEDIGDPDAPAEGRNEVAFILAHELSHILLGHFNSSEARLKRQIQLTQVLRNGVTAWNRAIALHPSGNAIGATPTKEAGKDISKLFLAAYLIDEYNLAVAGPKWARQQEEQADLMAIDLIHMLPQGDATDPNAINDSGASDILTRMAETEKKLNADKALADEQTKQPADKATGEDKGDNDDKGDRGDTQDSKDLMGLMSTKTAALAYAKWRQNAIGRVHDGYADRSKAIADYIRLRYPVSAQAIDFTRYLNASPPPAGPNPDRPKSTSSIWDGQALRTAVLPQIQARQLLDELAKGNCDTLPPDLAQFVSDEQVKTGRTQRENFALGAYDLCEAKWDDAIPLFRAAVQGPDGNTSFYLALIQTEQFRGRDADALADIAEAETRAPSKGSYLPLKIASLMALKRTDEAAAAAADCKAHETPDLGAACMASAGLTYDGNPVPSPQPADGKGADAGNTQPVGNAPKSLGDPPSSAGQPAGSGT